MQESEPVWQKPIPPLVDESLQERINNWFQDELDFRQQLFATTLALFNGIKYTDFEIAYEIVLDVVNIMNSESNEIVLDAMNPESDDTGPFFTGPDAELIKQVNAEIVREPGGQEEILKFKRPEYEMGVIQCLKDKYRKVLFTLIPALKQIGESNHSKIRLRAADAVAEIGKMDFPTVHSRVITPWAYDERAYVRAAAGYALAQLFTDQDMRTVVNGLLKSWSDQDNPGKKMITLGESVGQQHQLINILV
jgi:hypothetical protein